MQADLSTTRNVGDTGPGLDISRQAGVEFDIVGDGRAALDHALAQDYALVFMDIRMPEMDAVAAPRLLRDSHYRGPIVALTAHVMHGDVALYGKSGCTDVLGKPIARAHCHHVLREHVGVAEAVPEGLAMLPSCDYEAASWTCGTGRAVRGTAHRAPRIARAIAPRMRIGGTPAQSR